jgi:hypothetical protein
LNRLTLPAAVRSIRIAIGYDVRFFALAKIS